MKEIWKDVPVKPFNKNYQVSNLGRLKRKSHMTVSIYKSRNVYRNYVPSHLIKPVNPNKSRPRYLWQKRIEWQYHHKYYRSFVHRLVAKAFIPNPHNYPIINHKNRNESHNWVSNLEWCTAKYNDNYKDHNLRIAMSEGHPCMLWTKHWKHEFFSTRGAAMFLCKLQHRKDINNIVKDIGRVCRGEYQHVYGVRAKRINKVRS